MKDQQSTEEGKCDEKEKKGGAKKSAEKEYCQDAGIVYLIFIFSKHGILFFPLANVSFDDT